MVFFSSMFVAFSFPVLISLYTFCREQPINFETSETVKNSFAFSSSIGLFFICLVSVFDFCTFSARFLALFAALPHLWEQYFVTVVRAVNSVPQCWQIRCTCILLLIVSFFSVFNTFKSVPFCLKVYYSVNYVNQTGYKFSQKNNHFLKWYNKGTNLYRINV